MIRAILTLIAGLCTLATTHAAPRTITNDEYRFSVTLPDGWEPEATPASSKQVIVNAHKQGHWLVVYAHKTDKGVYDLRKFINNDGEIFPEKANYIGKPEYAPWWNLLRHSITRTYRTDEGVYIKQLVTMRARTVFILYAQSPTDDFAAFDSIFESVDIDLTHYGNLLLASNNMGTFWGCALLSLFPYLGWFAGCFFRKWRRSCRTDRRALYRMAGCVAGTFALFGVIFFTLHDDRSLAWIIVVVALLFWGFFASGNKFLRDMYKGVFN